MLLRKLNSYFPAIQLIKLLGYLCLLLFFTTCKKEVTAIDSSSSAIKYFIGGFEDKLQKVSTTKDGGFLYCGKTNNGVNGIDGFLMKVDANGNKQWYKTYGGSKYDYFEHAIECSDGGYIAVGLTNSIGKGAIDGNLTKLDYVVKIKASGELEWEHSYFPDSKGNGVLNYVVESNDHFIYAAGRIYQSSFTGMNTMLLKLDLSGHLIDSAQYSDLKNYNPSPIISWNESASFVSLDDHGNVLLGGSTDGTFQGNDVNFLLSAKQDTLKSVNYYHRYTEFVSGQEYRQYARSPFTVRVLNTADGYLIGSYMEDENGKVIEIHLLQADLNGNLLWKKEYRGLGSAMLYDMKLLTDGSILIAGTSSNTKFNFSYPEYFSQLNTMLMKLDKNGNELWVKYEAIDKNANILKGVYMNNDGSLSATGLTCLSKDGYDKMFYLKLDAKGNIKAD